MAGETDTLPNGGTESATQNTGYDTPDEFSFIERDDETDEGSDEGTEGAKPEDDEDDGATLEAESEGGETDDEPASGGASKDDTAAEATVKDDVTVTMHDGSRVSLGELKKGYLRQSDFTRKTTELASNRKTVSDQADRVSRIVETFTSFLASQVPDEPGLELLASDPQSYMLQKGRYDATINQMRELIALADQPKAVRQEMDHEDRRAKIDKENRALIDAVPSTATEKGRAAFFDDVFKAAGEFGFTDAEMKRTDDHRLLVMAHYASKGLAAEKAKATAKEKVAHVPPVQNAKPRQSTQNANAQRYQKHRDRLAQTGDIRDAVKAYLARQR